MELGGVISKSGTEALVREGIAHLPAGRALILYWQSVEVLYWILRKPLQTVWQIRTSMYGISPLENAVPAENTCEKVPF